MVGKIINGLKVIRESEKKLKTNRAKFYDCECSCGVVFPIRSDILKAEKQDCCKSCTDEKRKTHGMARTKFYYVWKAMNDRCHNKTHQAYSNYGGRGITVDWCSFEQFKADMFSSYKEGLEIDRVNNDGNYNKENCRWVTRSQNQSNKRVSGSVKYRGVCVVAGKYRASISIDGKSKSLGHFNTAIEAAKEFDKYAVSNNMDRKLNFEKEV